MQPIPPGLYREGSEPVKKYLSGEFCDAHVAESDLERAELVDVREGRRVDRPASRRRAGSAFVMQYIRDNVQYTIVLCV